MFEDIIAVDKVGFADQFGTVEEGIQQRETKALAPLERVLGGIDARNLPSVFFEETNTEAGTTSDLIDAPRPVGIHYVEEEAIDAGTIGSNLARFRVKETDIGVLSIGGF